MNRFAQCRAGKVIYIYETYRTMDQLSEIFHPGQEWFDVTGMDCEVGYILDFDEATKAIRFLPLSTYVPVTLDDYKTVQISNLKEDRNLHERDPIEYNERLFDFDSSASERLMWAILAGEEVEWTDFNDATVVLSKDDLTGLLKAIREREEFVHSIYNKGKERIAQAQEIEEVEAITWDSLIIE